MPLTEESQARITPTLQTVTRSLSLIGLGNSPALTRRHKVEELTEMTGRRSFSLTKPSSGLSENGACHVGFLVAWVVVSVFTLLSFFGELRPGGGPFQEDAPPNRFGRAGHGCLKTPNGMY